MSLRTKAILILILVVLGSLAAEITTGWQVLLPSFEALERKGAEHHLQLARRALDQRVDEIAKHCCDWARWDDMCSFLKTRDPKFLESSVPSQVFAQLQLNLIHFYNAEGRLVWGETRDIETTRQISIPGLPAAGFPPDSPVVHQKSVGDNATGLMRVGDQALLVSAYPILTSQGEGPIRGSVVMARILADPEIQWLRSQAGVDVMLTVPSSEQCRQLAQGIRPESMIDQQLDGKDLRIETVLPDLARHPLVRMQLFVPKSITAQGRQALRRMTAAVLLIGSLLMLSAWWALRRVILHPIQAITSRIMSIRESGDLSARVSSQRRDELGTLSREFDSLIQELAKERVASDMANRAKSEFLANMSHEIRTPMTAILGYTDLLAETITEPESRESLLTIQRNGVHLLSIINDILDLSKIEAGKMTVQRATCSPASVIAGVVGLMRIRAESKGLDLSVQYANPIPAAIQSDTVRLRQILMNLLGNAIKFTDSGSVHVVVTLEEIDPSEPKLRFDVVDTGIGMSSSQVSQLFQKFSQVGNSWLRRYEGTGLGLAISKRLAEMLGGNITVQSDPGQGSTFTLTIATGRIEKVPRLMHPAEVARTARQPEPAQPASFPRLDCRILLAEDGLDNQRLISHLLEKAGAQVVIAENGRLALEHIFGSNISAEERFDLVLMDMQMPVMDGYEAVRQLRSKGYRGPVIALTAHAMSDDRQKCLDAGCDDYLTKPVDRRKLITLVSHYTTAATMDPEPQCGWENGSK